MAIEILMPALSPTMEEGTLAKWLVKEGDTVSSGDILAEIETDKATMEFEAVDEGVIGKILIAAGTEGVKVNTAIAVLLEDGEDASAAVASSAPAEAAAPAAAKAPAEAKGPVATSVPQSPDWAEGTKMKQMTVREALREGMSEEMRRDETVYLMGEEVGEYQGAYKISQGMLDEFGPKRVVDTPITEHGFAGIAVGSAMAGLRPIVEFMTFNFAMQAVDHIINSAAKTLYMSGGQMGAPMVFRGPNGAAARVGAQHSQDYTAWYMQIPGLKVVSPYSAADAKGLMKTAIRDNNPVIFMEREIMYSEKGEVPEEEYLIPIGKADIKRAGTDVTIVSYNKMMKVALGAAEELAKEGISAEVIDLRTIRPLDWHTIVESVKKTNRLVIVEEQWPFASISSEISYRVQKEAFDYLDAPIRRICSADTNMHYAPPLVNLFLPDVPRTVELVKEVMYMKK